MKRTHKFGALATVVDGVRFASKKEARRDAELQLLVRAKEIAGLKRQVPVPLVVNGVTIGKYIADWEYFDIKAQRYVYEDAKGFQTPEFKLKWKICQAILPGYLWRLS